MTMDVNRASFSPPFSLVIAGFLVEQELLNLAEHLSSAPVFSLVSFVYYML
jgi:hypothetical protein